MHGPKYDRGCHLQVLLYLHSCSLKNGIRRACRIISPALSKFWLRSLFRVSCHQAYQCSLAWMKQSGQYYCRQYLLVCIKPFIGRAHLSRYYRCLYHSHHSSNMCDQVSPLYHDFNAENARIVPLVCSGQYKGYVTILALLFSLVIVHFGANWAIIRTTFISHNQTREDIAQEWMDYQTMATLLANTGAIGAIWIGDGLLVCVLVQSESPVFIKTSYGEAISFGPGTRLCWPVALP